MAKCPVCNTEIPENSKFCSECGYSISGAKTGKLNPDTVLENRYIVVKTLGRGGMGAVYLALDSRLDNIPVAIKEMSTGAIGGDLQAAISAFKKEASILVNLRHPALPRMSDFFSQGEDRWYLVMDYIEGLTLKEIVDERGPTPEAEVVNWARQLCQILDYLHQQNPPIIFRDLKPANIMLTPEGHVKLIDFGIARHFQQGGTADTTAYGSSGFAPPEQYGENQTDPRSDIYALGATLHYLLTGIDPGKTPFVFESPRQMARISPRMEGAVMKALEFKAENRPGNMQEMLRLLPMGAVRPAAAPSRNGFAAVTQKAVPFPAEPAVSDLANVRTTPLNMDPAAPAAVSQVNAPPRYPQPQMLDMVPPYSGGTAANPPYGAEAQKKSGTKILLAICVVLALAVGFMVYNSSSKSRSYTSDYSSYSDADHNPAADPSSDAGSASKGINITGQEGDKWHYDGPIRDDRANGYGTAVCTESGGNYEEGDKYTGDFENNKRSGDGTMKWNNGDMYKGEWKRDQRNGQGTHTYANDEKYEGEWRNNTFNGQGTYTWSDSEYTGDWKDGEMNGQGTRTWKDGDKYAGEWKQGRYNGQGTYNWANGDEFVGSWKDGERTGSGTLTETGGRTFTGEWKEGKRVGAGTIIWPSGEKYVGGWSDQGRHGWGTDTYPDGSYYVGGWENDEKSGQGTYYNADGKFNSYNRGY